MAPYDQEKVFSYSQLTNLSYWLLPLRSTKLKSLVHCRQWLLYLFLGKFILIFLTYTYKSKQQNVCIFQPQPRFLHTAVTTDEYLLVFGGRSVSTTTQDSLIAYSYACNQWIRLLSKGKFALSWFMLQYYAVSTLFC